MEVPARLLFFMPGNTKKLLNASWLGRQTKGDAMPDRRSIASEVYKFSHRLAGIVVAMANKKKRKAPQQYPPIPKRTRNHKTSTNPWEEAATSAQDYDLESIVGKVNERTLCLASAEPLTLPLRV